MFDVENAESLHFVVLKMLSLSWYGQKCNSCIKCKKRQKNPPCLMQSNMRSYMHSHDSCLNPRVVCFSGMYLKGTRNILRFLSNLSQTFSAFTSSKNV